MYKKNLGFVSIAMGALLFASCKKEGPSSGAANAMVNLPADLSLVINVDAAKVLGSDIYKKYSSKINSEMPSEVEEFKSKCGMDPFKDIKNIMFGVGDDTDTEMAVVINGNFDRAKIESCFKALAEANGKDASMQQDGKLTMFPEDVVVLFPADNSLVFSKGDWGKKALKELAGGKSIASNKEVMEMIGKVNSGAAIWMAGQVPAGAASMPMGAPPKSVYFSVIPAGGIEITGAAVFATDEEANTMKSMADMGIAQAKQIPQAADLVNGISINAKGKELTFSAKVSMEQIEKLEGMAGMMGI